MSMKSIPLEPRFYIVKLGFTGVYLFFLIFDPKHRLWLLVRTASAKIRKISFFSLLKSFIFFITFNSLYIAWASFRDVGKNVCSFTVIFGSMHDFQLLVGVQPLSVFVLTVSQ